MPRSFQLVAKPAGSACDLACHYCFYIDKPAQGRMPSAVLEAYIRDTIAAQPGEVSFIWQGGEPTLLGTAFFDEVVRLQQQYAQGKTIRNALQTHGGLLDANWASWLAEHDFLVGISIDGPADLHDIYRRDRRGQSTFAATWRGLELLQLHGVRFNTLTVVGAHNASAPETVYDFLKGSGSTHLQFIPLCEIRQAQSVSAEAWGEFLLRIFDHWVRHDVGQHFIQQFDTALAIWLGRESPLCLFSAECGRVPALEANGDVYACDHFVEAQWRLGNLLGTPLVQLVDSPQQQAFGAAKAALPDQCLRCEVRFACQGECPKNRTAFSADGEAGLNALCAGYRRFFNHIDLPMRAMARLLREGRPAADIMTLLRREATPC